MSLFLNNFSIFGDFPQEFKQNIKLFHVFKDIAYCVTNDDKVYGFGKNIRKFLGYIENNDSDSDSSDDSNEKNYVLIQELCDKSIEQFFGAIDVFFASSETNEIYSWGNNRNGQLARCFSKLSKGYLKPERNGFFSNKNIIQISCGYYQCLALSSDSEVYGWGRNDIVKIVPRTNKEIILTPVLLMKLNVSIKSIHCADYESYAVTFSGKVFCYQDEDYIDWEVPGERIFDLFILNHKEYICQTNESLYEKRDENWIKIDYKNPFEYYFIRYQITFKTIHLKNGEMFSINFGFGFNFTISEKLCQMKKNFETIDFNESKATISSSAFRDVSKTLKSCVKCFYKSKFLRFLL